jgi:hypothetical protein
MKSNVIDARADFLGKMLLDRLDKLTESHKDRYSSFLLIVNEDGKDYIELYLKDLEDKSLIVVDRAPVEVYQERVESNVELFYFG